MSDVEAGGATVFPYVGARVKPKKVRQHVCHKGTPRIPLRSKSELDQTQSIDGAVVRALVSRQCGAWVDIVSTCCELQPLCCRETGCEPDILISSNLSHSITSTIGAIASAIAIQQKMEAFYFLTRRVTLFSGTICFDQAREILERVTPDAQF